MPSETDIAPNAICWFGWDWKSLGRAMLWAPLVLKMCQSILALPKFWEHLSFLNVFFIEVLFRKCWPKFLTNATDPDIHQVDPKLFCPNIWARRALGIARPMAAQIPSITKCQNKFRTPSYATKIGNVIKCQFSRTPSYATCFTVSQQPGPSAKPSKLPANSGFYTFFPQDSNFNIWRRENSFPVSWGHF